MMIMFLSSDLVDGLAGAGAVQGQQLRIRHLKYLKSRSEGAVDATWCNKGDGRDGNDRLLYKGAGEDWVQEIEDVIKYSFVDQ